MLPVLKNVPSFHQLRDSLTWWMIAPFLLSGIVTYGSLTLLHRPASSNEQNVSMPSSQKTKPSPASKRASAKAKDTSTATNQTADDSATSAPKQSSSQQTDDTSAAHSSTSQNDTSAQQDSDGDGIIDQVLDPLTPSE